MADIFHEIEIVKKERGNKMIENLIFDMGNVLVDFSVDFMLSQFTSDLNVIKMIKVKTIYTDLWSQLDNGDLTFEEAADIVNRDMDPKYHEMVDRFLNSWHHYKTERLDFSDYLYELKNQGFKIYLLSNVAPTFRSYKDKYKFVKHLDGMVLSGELNLSKPGKDIYLHLLEKFDLNAKSCLFIDDSFANVETADKLGYYTYHYNGNLSLFKEFINNTILK